MSNILVVSSSAAGAGSDSRALALHFARRWAADRPEATITERALDERFPHYTLLLMTGLQRPEGERSPQEADAIALSDMLCAELIAADVIVIASPMYTLTISSTLKAWFEYVNRRDVAFEMGEGGARGLLGGRPVVIICSRGSRFDGLALEHDLQVPVIKAILDHFGLVDQHVVRAEALAYPAQRTASLDAARSELERLAATL